MTLQADANGVVTGYFTIPENIPAGTKSVKFKGSNGSEGEALYTGSGTINTRRLRRILTIRQGVDPLAQTFTLDSARQIAGVELTFTQLGTKPARVQIRETQTGLPNNEILTEASLNADEINLDNPTTFHFAPIFLEAGREYAIVVLTDDPQHEVAIAELGKHDQNHGWVTSQPYQVGVLLSSSNAQTWTAHQSMDLTFRLYAAKYTETSRHVDLGSATADNISDLLLLAGIERSVAGVDANVTATMANGAQYVLQEDNPLNLPSRLTGNVSLSARLTGSEKFSPVLYPGIQLAKGNLRQSADYITRAFNAGADTTLKVNFEAVIPGSAGVDVYAEIDGQWQQLSHTGTAVAENPWQELSYELQNIQNASIRVKLVLNGDPQHRPRVRALRAITI